MLHSTRRTFVLVISIVSFFLVSRPIYDPDFWWHLKTGQYIVENRTIPHTDIYSFTKYGEEWVTHEWLSEVFFYLLYASIGLSGLIVVFSLIVTVALWLAFRRFDGHPLFAGSVMILGAVAILSTTGVRPRVFTFLLASVFLSILVPYARSGNGRNLWWLVVLMIVWVNLHGGFLLGPALITLTIVGLALDGFAGHVSYAQAWQWGRVLGLVLLACFLAVSLNPNGIRIYSYPFETLFSPVQQAINEDWQSPDFHSEGDLPLAVLILAVMAGFALSPERPRPSDLLFVLASCFATLRMARNADVFVLIAIPVVAENLQNWTLAQSWGRQLATPERPATRVQVVVNLLLLLLPVALLVPRLKQIHAVPPVPRQPISAVEFLQREQIAGGIFNEVVWGGYLIWKLPSNPVYIDGRFDMYGDQFLIEYLDTLKGITDWREPFDRYHVRAVLIHPQTPLSRLLHDSPDWEKVYQDEISVIFVKR